MSWNYHVKIEPVCRLNDAKRSAANSQAGRQARTHDNGRLTDKKFFHVECYSYHHTYSLTCSAHVSILSTFSLVTGPLATTSNGHFLQGVRRRRIRQGLPQIGPGITPTWSFRTAAAAVTSTRTFTLRQNRRGGTRSSSGRSYGAAGGRGRRR